MSTLHATGVRLKELNVATGGGPFTRVKVDYLGPLFTPPTQDTTEPMDSQQSKPRCDSFTFKSPTTEIDYPETPCTPQANGTTKPMETPQPIPLCNAFMTNAPKKRRRVMGDRGDVRVSHYTQIVDKEERIIHASIDLKHRLRAHLVLRRSSLPDCNLGEIVTKSNIFVTGGAVEITILIHIKSIIHIKV